MQVFLQLFYILGQNNAFFLRFGIFLLKLFVNFLLRKGKNRTFCSSSLNKRTDKDSTKVKKKGK